MSSVSEKLIKEIILFSGNQLSIHNGKPAPPHGEFSMNGRASVYIDEHHAHVYLNGDNSEATLVHELLHVKSAWILKNPTVKGYDQLPSWKRGFFNTISTSLDHIYVLREQRKLGFEVPKYFVDDHCNIIDAVEKNSNLINMKAYGGLAFVYLRYGLITDKQLLKRVHVYMGAMGLMDWLDNFSKQIWKNKNDVRNLAITCYENGIFPSSECAMVVRNVSKGAIEVEHFD